MQDQMQEQMKAQEEAYYQTSQSGSSKDSFSDHSPSKTSGRNGKSSSEDYIEFEEVKANEK